MCVIVFDKKNAVHIINTTKLSVVICDRETTKQFLSLIQEPGLCPSLKWVVQMEPLSKEDKRNKNATDLQELEKYGARHKIKPEKLPKIGQDDLHTIVFTSGSTGTPKGVPFPERVAYLDVSSFHVHNEPLVGISISSFLIIVFIVISFYKLCYHFFFR